MPITKFYYSLKRQEVLKTNNFQKNISLRFVVFIALQEYLQHFWLIKKSLYGQFKKFNHKWLKNVIIDHKPDIVFLELCQTVKYSLLKTSVQLRQNLMHTRFIMYLSWIDSQG